MRNMRSVYIAGPYSAANRAGEDKNIMAAAEVAADFYRAGWAVFCPHVQTSPIDRNFNQDGAVKYEDWMAVDLYWLSRCDLVVFVGDWEQSRGACIEHMAARGLGKDIMYRNGPVRRREPAAGRG